MKYILSKKTYNSTDHCTSQGFTILETLVAISILILAITAPLAIIAQALRSSYYARDQITAYYLAQEAVEFLRNKRDFVGLQGNVDAAQWATSFQAYATPSNPDADIDILNNSLDPNPNKAYLIRTAGTAGGYKLVECPGNVCPAVPYSTADSGVLYGLEGDDSSIFTREIVIRKGVLGQVLDDDDASEDGIDRDPALREIVIQVRVTWRMADGTQSEGVTIVEHLTNWQLEKAIPFP